MKLRRHKTARRGATVVEGAFVLSIFVLFMLGILEYARFLFFMHVATSATSAAARYAVVHTGDGTTTAQVTAVANDAMAGQQSMVSGYTVDVFAAQSGVSPPTPVSGVNWSDAAFGNGVCVRITGTYSFVGGALIGISTLPVSVTAVMTSEAN